jgi:hypothetical protein
MSANPCLSGSDLPIQTTQVEFAATFSIGWNISLAPHRTREISEQCRDAMLEFEKLRPVLAGRLAEHAFQTAREYLGRDSSATRPARIASQSWPCNSSLDCWETISSRANSALLPHASE